MNRRVQVRTAFEIGSTFTFLAGLIRMNYADAITIQQFIPLAAMAGAAIFLGESVGWRRWLAAGIGFIGVLIVVQPGQAAFNWAALYILANVLCTSGRDLVTRGLAVRLPSVLMALMSIALRRAVGAVAAAVRDVARADAARGGDRDCGRNQPRSAGSTG